MYLAGSNPMSQVTWYNFLESFEKLCILKNKGWLGAEDSYSSFGVVPVSLYARPPSVQRFCSNRKQAMNPKSEKNIFNEKRVQFITFILFLINETDTSRFGSLLIVLKFR
jgi:hypothetical protein